MVRLVIGPALATSIASGCGSTTPPPMPATPADPADAGAGQSPTASPPAAWLEGTWMAASGDAGETWVRVDDRLIGFGFTSRDGATPWFEVMMIHAQGADTLLTAIPAGLSTTEFTATALDDASAEFVNPAHDDPKRLRYTRDGDELHVTVDGERGERSSILHRVAPRPAPALADADRAFDADSATRAGAAWADRFEPDAATWPRGSERTAGRDAVAASIDGLAARGLSLRWGPAEAGFSATGDVGFTTGRYAMLQTDAQDAAARGIYVTVWRRDPAGMWKIAFDTGLASPR